jgi:hypothetical protein
MRRIRLLTVFLCLIIGAIFVMQLSPSLATQLQRAGQKPNSFTKREGMITGRVITDDDRPAARAIVEARMLGSMFSVYGAIVSECDADGNFKLIELKPGAYAISASLPGYVDVDAVSSLKIHRIGESANIRLVRGGVITGKVTDASGEPLEGIHVHLRMVEGRAVSPNPLMQQSATSSSQTDDRGIYRIYGIIPGTYLVSVADTPIPYRSFSHFRHDSPSYYSSDERNAAVEVAVRSGEEITGIDIRHRGERGYSITGTVSGEIGSRSIISFVGATLRNEAGEEVGSTISMVGSRRFGIYGIPDGVYEMEAFHYNERFDLSFSMPLRITVKGADLTDIDLKLFKAGSISGRVVIESSKPGGGCGQQERVSVDEILLQVKKDDGGDRHQVPYFTLVNKNGDFVQGALKDGLYRIVPDLPGDNWYIKAMTMTAKETPNKTLNLARDGVSVNVGDSLTGLGVKVAKNAATLRGHLAAANRTQTKAGASSSSQWKVHLIPVEEESAEDVLRYAETLTQSNGSFELKHLAPGKYFLLAREVSEKDRENHPRPAAWDSLERTKLRRDAQSLRQEIELRPCQQATFASR